MSMDRRKRKQCRNKFCWQTMKAAQSYCWHKRHGGVNIQAYRCPHCGSIHVGHFRPDDLPELETTMSKTRVYQIWMGTKDQSVDARTFTDREDAEAFLAECHTARLMETDLPEEEFAELCMLDMKAQADWEQEQRTGNVQPGVVYSAPEPVRLWTDCSTRPAPPKVSVGK